MKIMRKIASLAGIVVLIALLGACSKKPAELYNYVSTDDMIVLTGDLKTIIENAGCTLGSDGVELSPSLEAWLNAQDDDDVKEVCKLRGVDPSFGVFAAGTSLPVRFAFGLTDADKFVEWISSLAGEATVTEADGYTIVALSSNTSVFVKDRTAVVLDVHTINGMYTDEALTVADLEAVKQKASDAPLAGWQRDLLAKGNALNVGMPMAAYEKFAAENGQDLRTTMAQFNPFGIDVNRVLGGFLAINCDLNGATMSARTAFYDASGALIELPSNDQVDKSLLKYASVNDVAVMMYYIPGDTDWDGLFAMLQSSPFKRYVANFPFQKQVVEVLSSIDGTVMVSAGPLNMLKMDDLAGWDGTVLARMKEGKAEEYAKMLKSMADGFGFKPDGSATDFSLKVDAATVYIKAEKDLFIASLSPITGKGGCLVDPSDFNKCTGSLGLNLPMNHFLSGMIGVPFGVEAVISSDVKGGRFALSLSGTEGGFLENILDYTSKM